MRREGFDDFVAPLTALPFRRAALFLLDCSNTTLRFLLAECQLVQQHFDKAGDGFHAASLAVTSAGSTQAALDFLVAVQLPVLEEAFGDAGEGAEEAALLRGTLVFSYYLGVISKLEQVSSC